MLLENLTYLITFVVTTGVAVMGVLIAYYLFHQQKNTAHQSLLYFQIFLFSFFIYGIWGNIAIRELISDLHIETQINNRLMFFIPLLGAPFLILSWFMLLRFCYYINGYKFSKWIPLTYFILFFAILTLFTWLSQNGTIKIPDNPSYYIAEIFAVTGLIIHLIAVYPFFRPEKSFSSPAGKFRPVFLIYLGGVVLYSSAAGFIDVYGFISICLFFVLIFAVSVILPAGMKFKAVPVDKVPVKQHIGFEEFCQKYDISKREAEIVLEICSGKTNQEIADKLFITLQTVKDHNHRIYSKTQVKTRVQLSNLVINKTGLAYGRKDA